MRRLSDTRTLALFFGFMYFLQSLADPGSGIVAQPLRSLLSKWQETPAAIAMFMAIVGLPWTLKPLFGLLSDFVPLFGSRRRIYLMLSTMAVAIGFALVAGLPVLSGSYGTLLATMILAAVGIAFGDVLIDAVMIDEGQPRGLTGFLQSVQWTAAYAGMLLTGVIGGYLSSIGRADIAFGLCSALGGLGLVIAMRVVRDHQRTTASAGFAEIVSILASCFRQPGLLGLGLMLFVWNFNPLWTTVLYLHLTDVMGLSEMTFGYTISIFSAGAMAGSFCYPFYCRRLRAGTLIHWSIVAGIGANVLYLLVLDENSAYAVAWLAGFAYMSGTMIQMDIAARRAPIVAAATVFALMMAVSNLASSVSEALGGNLYEAVTIDVGATFAWQVIVLLSAAAPALAWLVVPILRRDEPAWFPSSPTRPEPALRPGLE